MDSSRQSLIPSYLYSNSLTNRFDFEKLAVNQQSSYDTLLSSLSESPDVASRGFVVQAPSEPGKIKMFSPAAYAACAVGGSLSCGSTHTGITPLDVVKCNMQVILHLSLLIGCMCTFKAEYNKICCDLIT